MTNICEVIEQRIGQRVTTETRIEDLDVDSLEFVELLMIIGEISGKDVLYDAADEFITVGDIAAAVS